MTALLLTRDLREFERRAAECGGAPLMARAGLAAAALAKTLLGEHGRHVVLLAGPGNNGGDAFEAARHLKASFLRVTLVAPGDPARLPPDAAAAHAAWLAAGGTIASSPPASPPDLVIDGLFGIGLVRAPAEPWRGLIDWVNAQSCPVLALDLPSGLDADSGRVHGAAVRASHTLCFLAGKPGLYTGTGPDHCGEVRIDTLGVDAALLPDGAGALFERHLFAAALTPRRRDFHKGLAGNLGIVGGAAGMAGAALLAGRAALLLGAGRVYLGMLDEAVPRLDPLQPELMLREAEDLLGLALDALVIGPGLGRSDKAETLLAAALTGESPLVLDADALNTIAADPGLAEACGARAAATLLTPHPAEAARLLGIDTALVQADRVGCARLLAERFSAHVVLKGAGSVIALADGRWFVNTTGNPGMASAGMGDTLAGIVGALAAQRIAPEAALALGVHLHGAAADALAAGGDGPIGLSAGETATAARRLWNAWRVPSPRY